MSDSLIPKEELLPGAALLGRVARELDAILLGRPSLHRLVLAGLLSRGHILLEGLPGVGKTALVVTLSRLLGLPFKRVQFTPDLMPGDILGSHILQEREGGRRELVFTEGPVFTSLLLADEINRASPKTQSALLEAMQESAVTLLGTTRALPSPFFVLASQNPIELEGTYPPPEAQLDRFLFKLSVAPASVEHLEEIIATRRRGEPPGPSFQLRAEELADLFSLMGRVVLPRPVARYVSRLVAATHPGATESIPEVAEYVTYGASPRAAIGIAEAARAWALLEGRPTAGFADVKAVAGPVLGHRIILGYKARLDRVEPAAIVARLLASLDEAGLKLPNEVALAPS